MRPGILPFAALSITGLLVCAGCGGGDDGAKPKGNTGATGASASECAPAKQPRPRHTRKRKPPRFRLAADKTYIATVVTSCGSFQIELDSREAPRTGGSFVTLAREGFYDRLTFHRIVTGFVIQGGDPRGDGTGGPGYTIRETPPKDAVYSEGVVAMAKGEADPPGTSGSQFFVVTADSNLPPDYALLGRVTKGLDVVHRIEVIPAEADGRPVRPVLIKKIDVQVK